MSPIILLIVVVVAAVAAGAGYFIGYNNRKKTAEAQIGSAEAEATRLVNEAIKEEKPILSRFKMPLLMALHNTQNSFAFC